MSKVATLSLACLTPGCGKMSKSRGTCHGCAIRNRLDVKNGVTTWDELMEKGLTTAAKKKGNGYQGSRKHEP